MGFFSGGVEVVLFSVEIPSGAQCADTGMDRQHKNFADFCAGFSDFVVQSGPGATGGGMTDVSVLATGTGVESAGAPVVTA